MFLQFKRRLFDLTPASYNVSSVIQPARRRRFIFAYPAKPSEMPHSFFYLKKEIL
jgi:hypothetical protein